MTHPKDIKISAPEQFALLNDPDFLNQAVTRFLQQFLEAEITSFLQAERGCISSSLTTTKAYKMPSNDTFRGPLGSIVRHTFTEISKVSHRRSINAKSHRHSKTFSMHPILPLHKSAYLL